MASYIVIFQRGESMREREYESFEMSGVLPARAYYIPFAEGEDAFAPRRKSSRYLDLNGMWHIREYESVFDVEENFFEHTPKDCIPVPSCVQIHGYDHMQYGNVKYPVRSAARAEQKSCLSLCPHVYAQKERNAAVSLF